VNPWGEIVAELGEGLGYVVAECDPESQDTMRRQLPALTHRRAFETPDLVTGGETQRVFP
jgi:predicted amidohydrolase